MIRSDEFFLFVCGAVMYAERYLVKFPAWDSLDAYNAPTPVVTIKNISEL